MEKKRIRPVYNGNSLRISYSRQEEVLEIPDLIEVQKKSYEWLKCRKNRTNGFSKKV